MAIFWISKMLMLPGILLVYLSSPFLTSPKASITTGVVSVFISHILDNFSATFTEVLLSDGIATAVILHLLSRLSLKHYVVSIGIYFSISVDGHFPENGDFIALNYGCALMVIPLVSSFYVPLPCCDG